MLFPLIAAVIVALVLLLVVLLGRRNAALADRAASSKLKEIQLKLDSELKLRQEAESAKVEAEQALEESSERSAALNTDLEAALSQTESLQAAADELSEGEQQSAERIAVLEIDVKRLRGGLPEIEPLTLWELELQRSERTWRHSVSVSPDNSNNPFLGTTDRLQLAVEVEAAALREEAGAFLTVDWQAAPVEDPARAHLILRLAQEMLAEAAREPLPARLIVAGTGAVTLTMVPSEEEDKELELNLTAPDVSGQLIEIDETHKARITVSYG